MELVKTENNISFTLTAQEKNARQGTIVVKNTGKRLATPQCMLYSRKGNPPNLTPDLLEEELCQADVIQVALKDM
jgi:hypothetical protein